MRYKIKTRYGWETRRTLREARECARGEERDGWPSKIIRLTTGEEVR